MSMQAETQPSAADPSQKPGAAAGPPGAAEPAAEPSAAPREAGPAGAAPGVEPAADGEATKHKGAGAQTQAAMADKLKGERYGPGKGRTAPAGFGGNYAKTKDATQPAKPRTEPVPKKCEQLLGKDFSQVHLHFGTGLPEKQHAQAFTQGTEIYFADAAPKPETAKGMELLGHELAHVVQQNPQLPAAPGGKGGDKKDAAATKGAEAEKPAKAPEGAGGAGAKPAAAAGGAGGEQEADNAGAAAAKGEKTTVKSGSAPKGKVQKKDAPTAGTKEAEKANQATLDATVDDRVVALKTAIDAKSWDDVTRQLAGGGGDLEAKYLAQHKVGLRASLNKAFWTIWQQDYLGDLLTAGKPSKKNKIALSLGLVSTSACNEEEVIKLAESCDPVEFKDVWVQFSGYFHMKLSAPMCERLHAFHFLSEAVGAKPAPGDVQKAIEIKEMWKVGHLAAVVKSRSGWTGVDREHLIEDVKAWVESATIEERNAAFAEGSDLRVALDAASGVIWGLGSNDRQQILDLVKPPEDIATDPKAALDPNDPDAAKKAEEAQKQKVADADAVAGLERTLTREQASIINPDEEAVKANIEAMSDAQRDIYLVKHMSAAEQIEWKDPTLLNKRKQELFDKAMVAIGVELDKAGLDKKEIAGVSARFKYGAAMGSSYQQLKMLVGSPDWTSMPAKIIALVAELKGPEFAQVRQDRSLIDGLRTNIAAGTPEFAQLEALLGSLEPVDDKAKPADGADKKAEEDATLNPKYWATRITFEVERAMLLPDQDKILAEMYQAKMAAKKSDAKLNQGQPGTLGPQADSKKYLSVSDFLLEVSNNVSGSAQTWLFGAMPAVFKALQNGYRDPGSWITVKDRLDQAKGIVAGLGSVDSAIVASFEDLTGMELLKEWSNFSEFRNLMRSQKQLEAQYKDLAGQKPKDEGKLKGLEGEIGRSRSAQSKFILSINDDKRAYLQSQMSTGEVVGTLKKLQTKFATAAEQDQEFKKALEDAKMPNDAYMRERMKSLATLDEQSLEDTTAQFEGFSAKSQERKEAGNELIAEYRGTNQKIEAAGGDQAKVATARDEGAASIDTARKELDRRTAAFDAMRSKAKEIAAQVIAIVVGLVVAFATGGAGAASWPVMYQMLLAGGTQVAQELAKVAIDGESYKLSDGAKEVILGTLAAGLASQADAIAGALRVGNAPEAIKAALGKYPMLGEVVAEQVKGQINGIVTGVPEDLARSFLTDEKPFASMGETLKASATARLLAAPQAVLTGTLKSMAQNGMFAAIDQTTGSKLGEEQTTVGGTTAKTLLASESDKAMDYAGETAVAKASGASTKQLDATSVVLGQAAVAAATVEAGGEVKYKEDVLKSGDPKTIAVTFKIASDDPAAVAKDLAGKSVAEANGHLEAFYLKALTGAQPFDKTASAQFGIENNEDRDAFMNEGAKDAASWKTVAEGKAAVDAWKKGLADGTIAPKKAAAAAPAAVPAPVAAPPIAAPVAKPAAAAAAPAAVPAKPPAAAGVAA